MDDGKAVLVTGCSSGIGRATALALVARGYTTWASARRPEALGDLEAAGCRTVQLDVTDEMSRVQAVELIESVHGHVHALVNNAGYTHVSPVEELSMDDLRRQFETNVFGLVRLCQLVLPGMRAAGQGTIVNIGSAAGLATTPGSAAYCMSKYAIESLTDALRYEVRPFGVRVTVLEPQGVRTQLMETDVAHADRTAAPGPYDSFKRNLDAFVAEEFREGNRAILPPERVANVVVKAITARRPKTRYRVGSHARLLPIMRRSMGDRMWDRVLQRYFPFE